MSRHFVHLPPQLRCQKSDVALDRTIHSVARAVAEVHNAVRDMLPAGQACDQPRPNQSSDSSLDLSSTVLPTCTQLELEGRQLLACIDSEQPVDFFQQTASTCPQMLLVHEERQINNNICGVPQPSCRPHWSVCGHVSRNHVPNASVCSPRNVQQTESCGALASTDNPSPCPVVPSQSAISFDKSFHRAEYVCGKRFVSLGRKLLKAAEAGKTNNIRQLLNAGADPNFTFGSEWTPLHKAARKGHAEAVSVLLLRGANPHARTTSGFTALHIAAYNDFCGQCVSILLDAGSDIESRNLSGRTPLHYAAEGDNKTAVRKLLFAGADKYAINSAGQTPYHVAKSECVRRLLL